MVLINEDGRLFGRINIVDFLIVLLVLIIVPTFIYIYIILSREPVKIPHEWVRVKAMTFTIPKLAELFKEGDVSYDQYRNLDGRILKIFEKPSALGDKIKAAMLKKSPDVPYEYRTTVFIEFELLCSRGSKDERWYYRRQPIFVGLGDNFTFETNKYSANCYIVNIEDK